MTAPYDCIKCGAKHGMVIHNNVTNEDTPIDICYECLFSCMKYERLSDHIQLDEVKSMTVEEMRLQMQANEAELLKGADEWLDLTISSLKTVVAWIEKKQEKFKNESR